MNIKFGKVSECIAFLKPKIIWMLKEQAKIITITLVKKDKGMMPPWGWPYVGYEIRLVEAILDERISNLDKPTIIAILYYNLSRMGIMWHEYGACLMSWYIFVYKFFLKASQLGDTFLNELNWFKGSWILTCKLVYS